MSPIRIHSLENFEFLNPHARKVCNTSRHGLPIVTVKLTLQRLHQKANLFASDANVLYCT